VYLTQSPRAEAPRILFMRISFVVCLLAMASIACNAKEKDASDKAGTEGTKAGAEGKSECEQYAAQLCEKLGEQSQTCASAKEVTELMPAAACKAGMADMAYTVAAVEKGRAKCTELMEKLCKDLGEDTESCQMVRAQTPSFPPERCNVMMEQYDEVVADLRRREDANKPLDEARQAKLLEGATATFGPTDSKVHIVEFSDFQCPYCSRSAAAVGEIKEKYGDKVHFVFRQFPLSFHSQAHLAAQAALAANQQGKFWPYHDKLFANQQALGRENLEAYAKELKLDMPKFNKALDDGAFKSAVDTDLKLGSEVSVSGTPTMFLNGKRISNPTDAAVISKAIEEALAAQ